MVHVLDDNKKRREIIQRFSPVLFFHPDERYFPDSIDRYVNNTRLRLDIGGSSDISVLDKVKSSKELIGHYLLGQHSSGLYQSNYFLEICDDHKEITRAGDLDNAECYVRVRRSPSSGEFWDILYICFYPYNGTLGGFGAHEGDWEHITVRTDIECEFIEKIYYSAHFHEGGWFYQRDEENPNGYELTAGTHPIVYVAKDSHACYPIPGIRKRSANNLHSAGLIKLIGGTLPDDHMVERPGGGPRWSCENCLNDVTGGMPRFLHYSGLWGEVGPSFSGPRGPAFQSWWEDDDSCQLRFNSSVEFLRSNNCCGEVIFRTSDDAGQVITEKMRRGFVNDQTRSLILKSVRNGAIITLYDSPDGKKSDDWTRIEVLKGVNHYFLETLEVAKSDPVVCVSLHKSNGLDGKVSRIEID